MVRRLILQLDRFEQGGNKMLMELAAKLMASGSLIFGLVSHSLHSAIEITGTNQRSQVVRGASSALL
jgi:hypothetical protein